ncbi:MAG: hypothetical protein WDZ35_00365 [Crocinitomicaceae bacterium]
MHKGRITLIVASIIGVFSIFLPWVVRDMSGLKSIGIDIEKENITHVTQLGLDTNYIFVGLIGFALIALVSIMGDRSKMISKGIPKMSVLVISGLLSLFHLFLIIVLLLTKYESPTFGVYLAFSVSLIALIVPYLFKANGEFDIPSGKEISRDIEENVEVIEEIADEAEDSIIGDDDEDDDKGKLEESDAPKK